MPKTICPVSREDFLSQRPAMPISIGGTEMELDAKEFASGGFGWEHRGGNIEVLINGEMVKCWPKLILSIVGSKEV